jgi:hypothetical protein
MCAGGLPGMEKSLPQHIPPSPSPHQPLKSYSPLLPPPSSPYTPQRTERLLSKEDTFPDDIREMTIRNLDTGEEFIIGENDPDFEFDTFPLSAGEFLSFTRPIPLIVPSSRWRETSVVSLHFGLALQKVSFKSESSRKWSKPLHGTDRSVTILKALKF